MARQVNSLCGVVEELGGVKEVAAIFGVTESCIYNWMRPDRGFPPDTYEVMQDLLRVNRCIAPGALWNMREAVREAAE